MDRKSFLNSFIRLSLLGFLVLLTGFLATRRTMTGKYSCSTGSLCSNCPELTGCTKPEAIKQKRDERKK